MTADRFLLQQAWWLASELGRRHPAMWVDRFVDAGSGPVLVAFDPDSELQVFFDLHLGIRCRRGDQHAHWSWETHAKSLGGHDTLKRIENTMGFGLRGKAPATTARSLIYRVIARLLAMHVDAARPWVPVTVQVEPMVQGKTEPTTDPIIAGFGSVHADVLEHRKLALSQHDDPAEIGMRPYLWAMTRDVDTAFVLDTDGFVHTRERGVHAMLGLYDALGRDIDRLTVRVLELAGATRG